VIFAFQVIKNEAGKYRLQVPIPLNSNGKFPEHYPEITG
jgi:hypothetical protein